MSPAIKPSTIRHILGGKFSWREKEDTGLKHLHGGSNDKESACKVQSLVRELRSHKLHHVDKKKDSRFYSERFGQLSAAFKQRDVI